MGMLEDIQNDVKKLLDANKKVIREALDEVQAKKKGEGGGKWEEHQETKQEDPNKTGKEAEVPKEKVTQDTNQWKEWAEKFMF